MKRVDCDRIAYFLCYVIGPVLGAGILFFLSITILVWAHPIDPTLVLDGPFKHRVYGRTRATVVQIKDGDTISFNIADYPKIVGHEIDVRVYGVDTPELSEGGSESLEYVRDVLPPGTEVVLDRLRRGKYFRIVADVILPDGSSLAQQLLERELAVPYFGGKKGETP